MQDAKLVAAYVSAAGITEKPDADAALAAAYSQRDKEIDRYWQRANYTWALQLIFFTTAALGFKDGQIVNFVVLTAISFLGSVAALTGILMAKGSKFWIENWEGHIEILESYCGRATYKISVIKGPMGYSVSHLNHRLMQIFFCAWVIVFCGAMIYTWNAFNLINVDSEGAQRLLYGLPVLLAFAFWWVVSGQRLRLSGKQWTAGSEGWTNRSVIEWPWWPQRSKPAERIIVRE